MNRERNGLLASAAWTAALAARADPARYRRGKEYVRENAVVELTLDQNTIVGAVLGSRATPYRVTITLPPLTGPVASVNGLVPVPKAIAFTCTCPDWDEPCKHAVAVGIAFAERLKIDPDALAAVRAGAGAVPAVASPPDRRHLTVVRPNAPVAPVPPPWSPEVTAFLDVPAGAPELGPVPELEPLTVGRVSVGAVDLGELVTDAVHWLGVMYGHG